MNKHCYRKAVCIVSIIFSIHSSLLPASNHLVIIGSGIAASFEAWFAYKQNPTIKITIFEKESSIFQNASTHIHPSLTPDEIVSVIPRGPLLLEKSKILFSLPGGIRVDDVVGIENSVVAQLFKDQASLYSLDEIGHKQRTQDLLGLGKLSMDLWQNMYETGDTELREILKSANFNPCCEPRNSQTKCLHDGYRIDLIYNVANAQARALGMIFDYTNLGYTQCTLLTPLQVITLDPSLTQFCNQHSTVDNSGNLQWNNDTVALWRPGGCIDASVFIPKLYDYLEKKMGTYVDEDGLQQKNFQIRLSSEVTGVLFDVNDAKETRVSGLKIGAIDTFSPKPEDNAEYVFCPGESIGTLKSLGFAEPAYAGFAGAVLVLTINIPEGRLQDVATFNHCMEVHQEGVVLAWQARLKNNKIVIGVGGTKAFYADQKPNTDQAFSKNRNLLQLNMINDVLPEFVSWALGYDSKNKTLTEYDLQYLENKKIATRWVGNRAVAYDGFPTLGYVYKDNLSVINARCTTHLGSGGVSFAPAVTLVSRSVMHKTLQDDEFIQRILQYGNSARTASL